MYDKQGLRLALDGIGPGYAFEMNTLRSPLEIFIGDAAAAGAADSELALGKVAVQPRPAGRAAATRPTCTATPTKTKTPWRPSPQARPPLLDWHYGVEIVRLTMAAYLSAERRATVDLTDPATARELETYVPLIQQGRGGEVFGS